MGVQESNFRERCYAVLSRVPKGKVTTYQEIAKALGSTAWRAVGSAMAKNKNLVVVPCHRVVHSDGTIGEYALGAKQKGELLLKEGVAVANGRVTDLNTYLHRF